MTKKDRIAIVVSIFATIFGFISINTNTTQFILGWAILICILIYWSYRFIKNDISFIKMRDE